jgi:hypothetical protein
MPANPTPVDALTAQCRGSAPRSYRPTADRPGRTDPIRRKGIWPRPWAVFGQRGLGRMQVDRCLVAEPDSKALGLGECSPHLGWRVRDLNGPLDAGGVPGRARVAWARSRRRPSCASTSYAWFCCAATMRAGISAGASEPISKRDRGADDVRAWIPAPASASCSTNALPTGMTMPEVPRGLDTLIPGFGLGKGCPCVWFVEVSRAVPSGRGCVGAFHDPPVGCGGPRVGGQSRTKPCVPGSAAPTTCPRPGLVSGLVAGSRNVSCGSCVSGWRSWRRRFCGRQPPISRGRWVVDLQLPVHIRTP